MVNFFIIVCTFFASLFIPNYKSYCVVVKAVVNEKPITDAMINEYSKILDSINLVPKQITKDQKSVWVMQVIIDQESKNIHLKRIGIDFPKSEITKIKNEFLTASNAKAKPNEVCDFAKRNGFSCKTFNEFLVSSANWTFFVRHYLAQMVQVPQNEIGRIAKTRKINTEDVAAMNKIKIELFHKKLECQISNMNSIVRKNTFVEYK